jgi:leucyl aminopeptidase (aminopeptidase T)
MVMREVAVNALTHVLEAKEGEHLLIVTDEHRIEIGNAFYEAADRLNLEGRLFVLADGERPLEEVPNDLRQAMDGAHIVVTVFVAYPEETPFRIKLLEASSKKGARVGHGPGITDDMMMGGAMKANFVALKEIADNIMGKLKGSVSAHLTSPNGTDLWLTLRGREFLTDVSIPPGTFGNLPPGELWVAPVETEVSGTFVCDASIGDLGPVTSPVTFEVVDGRITSIRGEDQKLVERVRELTSLDEQASVVGELGLGINPAARLIGNLLEDEKAAGTAHIAFGNNLDMPGGKNSSKTHRDFLVNQPTLVVELEDGGKHEIIKDGCLVD